MLPMHKALLEQTTASLYVMERTLPTEVFHFMNVFIELFLKEAKAGTPYSAELMEEITEKMMDMDDLFDI